MQCDNTKIRTFLVSNLKKKNTKVLKKMFLYCTHLNDEAAGWLAADAHIEKYTRQTHLFSGKLTKI